MGRLFSRPNVSYVPDITSCIAKRVADFSSDPATNMDDDYIDTDFDFDPEAD